jgi:hypothetical protein
MYLIWPSRCPDHLNPQPIMFERRDVGKRQSCRSALAALIMPPVLLVAADEMIEYRYAALRSLSAAKRKSQAALETTRMTHSVTSRP